MKKVLHIPTNRVLAVSAQSHTRPFDAKTRVSILFIESDYSLMSNRKSGGRSCELRTLRHTRRHRARQSFPITAHSIRRACRFVCVLCSFLSLSGCLFAVTLAHFLCFSLVCFLLCRMAPFMLCWIYGWRVLSDLLVRCAVRNAEAAIAKFATAVRFHCVRSVVV